jgi:hypothetical protein
MSSAEQSGLAVVGVYWYPHEAQLARVLLETEGIRAWVLDEHQVQIAPLQWLVTLGFAFLGALVPLRRVRLNYNCPTCSHTWSASAR